MALSALSALRAPRNAPSPVKYMTFSPCARHTSCPNKRHAPFLRMTVHILPPRHGNFFCMAGTDPACGNVQVFLGKTLPPEATKQAERPRRLGNPLYRAGTLPERISATKNPSALTGKNGGSPQGSGRAQCAAGQQNIHGGMSCISTATIWQTMWPIP